MQHSDQPYIELERARAEIKAMREAQDMEAFEAAWKRYLHHLDRIWNKLEGHFSRSPKWNVWLQQSGRNRSRRDPLLQYLTQARNVEEHSVEPITAREPSSLRINPAEGKVLSLRKLIIDSGVIRFESDTPVVVDFVPTRVKLVPVTNRGTTYVVPTQHLGQAIDPTDVVTVAELALRFYESSLEAAEEFFVS